MSLTITVSQLNAYAASVFRGDKNFRSLIVRGEISNFVNYRKSGHLYFTLKEGGCAVKAVMFCRYASALKFMPENGMNVLASASVEVYERDGVYQLYVTDLFPDGAGALFVAAEQLKAKLAAEGIFNAEHKKPIPFFPKRIGIVTSREGAALRDMLNIIKRRCPVIGVELFNCAVQGRDAPASICSALALADKSGCDVIICGRGGGSAEDLSAFDCEETVRAIYNCKTPVISAVGHETDTTVADYAADLRAPTPSAAAELATPLMSELISNLDSLRDELIYEIQHYIALREASLDSKEKRLSLLSPMAAIEGYGQKLSDCNKRLNSAICGYFSAEEKRLASLAARLDALCPLKIMSRGYSLVFAEDKIIYSASELSEGDKVRLRFSDGEKNAIITS